ncbi:MAG: polysaccharide lyase family 7 protein [Pseudonocardia sp.]
MRGTALAAAVVLGMLLTGSPAMAAPPRVPADVLDLSTWKLTLPTGESGRPTEILQPQLGTYTDEHFRLTERRDGVAFTAGVEGVTTRNSSYPRSELREMRGGREASWSNTRGEHTLWLRAAITRVPPGTPNVVAAQIHDTRDDVAQIRLEGRELSVQWDDGRRRQVLDPDYRLGTRFEVTIVASGGTVRVAHDGRWRATIDTAGTGWYFKAGSYVQSNASRGDDRGAVGEVIVHGLRVTHSDRS